MRVMTLIGTRPEIIRLSETIKVFDKVFDHVLVHTGQNYDYELNQALFEDLGLRKPDYFLAAAGESPIQTVARVLVESDRVLAEVAPEALLILGDTNSALAAYSAKRRHIPIFHMEAGNRCFDFRVPEEINRRIVDHISDVNLAYSEHARRYLIEEGLPPDRIIKTGSPLKEVVARHRKSIDESLVRDRFSLVKAEYFVVSLHREENVDLPDRLNTIACCLNALAEHHDVPVVFSVHPRTARRLSEGNVDLDPRIRLVKPLGFVDYIALQVHARCVISDSGTITEEASILGFPAVTLRQSHERPEGMDEGAVVLCDANPERLLLAVSIAVQQFVDFGPSATVTDYLADQVSWKVAKIVTGYTDLIRREVWKEPIC